MTEPVIQSLRDGTRLDAIGYGNTASRDQRREKSIREADLEADLVPLLDALPRHRARQLKRSQECGAWITATPNILNGTVLSCTEFQDSLQIRYGLDPLKLPYRCDSCHERFTVSHALKCAHGGLILQRHNDVAAEWHQLCAQALTPSAVSDEPAIPNNQDLAERGDERPALRGDLAAHGFWCRGTTAIFDVRVTDTDATSQRTRDPAKILKKQEDDKKNKYGEACRAAHRHFTPLVYSVDGMEGGEAKAARRRVASRLATKWGKQYSQMCGFVRSRISISLVRATSRCLRGTRKPDRRQPDINWVAGTGMRLY